MQYSYLRKRVLHGIAYYVFIVSKIQYYVQLPCYLFFLSCISLITDDTSAHHMTFLKCLYTLEHPYLISTAFHIIEGCAAVHLAILVAAFLACQ